MVELFGPGLGIGHADELALLEEEALHTDVRADLHGIVIDQKALADGSGVFVAVDHVAKVGLGAGGRRGGQADLDGAEMAADTVARYTKLYDEALEGYERSKADKVTERVVETETARGPKKKRTVSRVNQVGQQAFLAAGRRAVDGMAKIVARVAPRRGKVAGPNSPITAERGEYVDVPPRAGRVEAPDQGSIPPEAAAEGRWRRGWGQRIENGRSR